MLARYALAAAICLLATPALADPPAAPRPEPTLSVRGAGTVEVKPDFARLNVHVSVADATLAAATAALPAKADKAMALLRSLEAEGVTIERSDYSLDERRTPVPCNPPAPSCQNRETREFTSSVSYALKIDKLDALQSVYTKLNAAGLFEIQTIAYDVKDRRGTVNLARRDAVVDAQRQAATYADAASLKLLDIQSIVDDEAIPPNGYADLGRPVRFANAPMQLTVIPPATLSFNATVTITWRIAPK